MKGFTASRPAWLSRATFLALAATATTVCAADAPPKPPRTFQDCPTCPPMVAIPAGSFIMGSPASEEGRDEKEGPQRAVKIAAFAVARHETTFAEWDACVAEGGCDGHKADDDGWGRGNLPVIDVDWHNAKAYVAWLSKKTGKRYRLLTEAEWEYVARAGTSTRYDWGTVASHEYANYGKDECCDGFASGRDKWVTTAPVESFPANAFGLHDMLGNVREWTEDCWEESHAGGPATGAARLTGNCNRRVVRGGSWASLPVRIRIAYRDAFPIDDHGRNFGFRIARSN